jgi:hypothetical protein
MLYKPTPPAPAADAFVVYPVSALPASTPEQLAWQKSLYEWAFAQAQAVVRPSILDMDLLGVDN